MEEASGRGHREKIPSAKVKEQVLNKMGPHNGEKHLQLPVYIAAADPKFTMEQKEITKTLDHVKTGPNGERTEFYTLGSHLEAKDKRTYIRARRDPDTMYFHRAEIPPCYARISDEFHPICTVDNLKNCFTKDMLGKTGEFGSYTSRANVCAREGQYYFETKIISQAPPGQEAAQKALAETQNADRTATNRGGLRMGFCRREHGAAENLGTNGYSYAVVLRSGFGLTYGNVRYNQEFLHLSGPSGRDFGDLKVGDVVGLMITLPSLDIHKKVVEGTFNPEEYPDLKCGPATAKPKRGPGAKRGPKGKGKEKERDGTPAVSDDAAQTSATRAQIQSHFSDVLGMNSATVHDIVRDRNPFIYKGMTYFESPDYLPHADLGRSSLNTKQKSINPETGKLWDISTDAHPNHELPHLRTLPGSKIECWVNGKYHGIVREHLFAFLPPASVLDKSNSKNLPYNGEIDDGMLGYYPAITHYSGGAIECKFDGPWWYGYDKDGPSYPDCKDIGVRYNEQIVEDFICDFVDEAYNEWLNDEPDWMKKRVAGVPNRNA